MSASGKRSRRIGMTNRTLVILTCPHGRISPNPLTALQPIREDEMPEFSRKAHELFDAGKLPEMIQYCRDTMLITDKKWIYSADFARMANGPIGEYIMKVWDGQPDTYAGTFDGHTHWVKSQYAKAA